MSVGISKAIFVVGLIAAIFGSAILSTVVTTQWAKGPKGDKGDTGETGPQGSQGPQGLQGLPGLYVADYDSGWIDITDKTGQYFNITHGLNSTDIIVDITGKTTLDGGVHQRNLGGTDYVLDRGKTYVLGSAMSMVKTSDGGYVIAGYTTSGTSGVDFQMVKIDPSWNTQWSKSYATAGVYDDYAYSVVQTDDEGYALAGSTYSVGNLSVGNGDFWLVKTDSTGTAQWNKTYWGTGYDSAQSLVQTSDGGYAIAGYTDSYGAGSWDCWLVKTDSAGTALWNKTYGGTSQESATSLFRTSDGGYALAGYTTSFGEGYYDFYLVKTDSDGNMVWNKTYGGTSFDSAYSVVQTSDGGYALAGMTYSYGAGDADFWLVRTDAAGNALWNRTYGGINTEEAKSVVQTSDGGYALAGYTNSFGVSVYNYDSWLVKTDSTGNAEWNRTYGGTSEDRAESLVQTSDGGYTLAGYTYSFGAGAPQWPSFWLVKTDSAGKLEWVQDWFKYGLALTDSTNNVITLYRGASDVYWNYVRVRIWKPKTP